MRRGLTPYLIADQRAGRPRTRFYVSEWRGAVLDAHELRRQARDEGRKLAAVASVTVAWSDRTGERREARVTIEAMPHAIYGVRWWLVCPLCGSRRVKLYLGKRGPACRRCLNLAYTHRVH